MGKTIDIKFGENKSDTFVKVDKTEYNLGRPFKISIEDEGEISSLTFAYEEKRYLNKYLETLSSISSELGFSSCLGSPEIGMEKTMYSIDLKKEVSIQTKLIK